MRLNARRAWAWVAGGSAALAVALSLAAYRPIRSGGVERLNDADCAAMQGGRADCQPGDPGCLCDTSITCNTTACATAGSACAANASGGCHKIVLNILHVKCGVTGGGQGETCQGSSGPGKCAEYYTGTAPPPPYSYPCNYPHADMCPTFSGTCGGTLFSCIES